MKNVLTTIVLIFIVGVVVVWLGVLLRLRGVVLQTPFGLGTFRFVEIATSVLGIVIVGIVLWGARKR